MRHIITFSTDISEKNLEDKEIGRIFCTHGLDELILLKCHYSTIYRFSEIHQNFNDFFFFFFSNGNNSKNLYGIIKRPK